MINAADRVELSQDHCNESCHATEIGVFVAEWAMAGLKRLRWFSGPGNAEITEKFQENRVWNEQAELLETALADYLAGNFAALDAIPIDGSDWTPFFSNVYRICRDIPAGQTLTYADLAVKAGSSGAARAVGQAMRTNQLPVIIPCHRVVGSGGKLHGYSGPGGLATKQLLLDLERGVKRLL